MKWFKRLFNKEEKTETYSRLDELDQSCKNMREELETTKRILRYSERGKITYYSYVECYGFHTNRNTYFYKDFLEYKIHSLYLYDAKIIDENLIDGIIQVIDVDEEDVIEYVINLSKGSYIKTKVNHCPELHNEQ